MPPVVMLILLVVVGLVVWRTARRDDAWMERERERVAEAKREAFRQRAELAEQQLPTNSIRQRNSDFPVRTPGAEVGTPEAEVGTPANSERNDRRSNRPG